MLRGRFSSSLAYSALQTKGDEKPYARKDALIGGITCHLLSTVYRTSAPLLHPLWRASELLRHPASSEVPPFGVWPRSGAGGGVAWRWTVSGGRPQIGGFRSRGSDLVREVADEPLVDLDRRQRQAGFAGHVLKGEVVALRCQRADGLLDQAPFGLTASSAFLAFGFCLLDGALGRFDSEIKDMDNGQLTVKLKGKGCWS